VEFSGVEGKPISSIFEILGFVFEAFGVWGIEGGNIGRKYWTTENSVL